MNGHTEALLGEEEVRISHSRPRLNCQGSAISGDVLVVAPSGQSRDRLVTVLCHVSLQLKPVFLETWNGNGADRHDATAYTLALVDFDADRPRAMSEFVRGLRGDYPGMPIVVVASLCDEALIETAIDAGATSVVPSQYTNEQIAAVLTLATTGVGHRPSRSLGSDARTPEPTTVANPQPAMSFEQNSVSGDILSKLSEKQLEVLSLISDGLTNSQIAQRLHVKVGTVKTHVTQILRRLGVERRAEAILKAQRMRKVREQQVAFARSGEGLLNVLLPHVTYARYHRGDLIFRKGDQARHLYYIKSGTVRMVEIEKTCGPGEIFGEIGMFVPDGRRTSTALCDTDVEVFFMTEGQVQEMLYMNPQFAIHVAATIAGRLFADRSKKAVSQESATVD